MPQKVISITEAKKYFPKFEPQWQAFHPDCKEPESVALGNPRFGTVRHMVVVLTDEQGIPTKPLYDKMQIEEGAADQSFPGTIIVPWFRMGFRIFIFLREKERPVRGTDALEFPQGYAERMETSSEAGIRELAEEMNLNPSGTVTELSGICPEPDWFPRTTAIVAVEVDPTEINIDQCFSVDDLGFSLRIDSGTSLAALMRFLSWIKNNELFVLD